MINIYNFFNNPNIKEIASLDYVKVMEYQKDLNVYPDHTTKACFNVQTNVKKRQVVVDLRENSFIAREKEISWRTGKKFKSRFMGHVEGFFKEKGITKLLTKTSSKGNGFLVLKATYNHILLERVENWGSLVFYIDVFLGCDDKTESILLERSSVLEGEKDFLFVKLIDFGITVLEIPVPKEELITVEIQDDEFRVYDNFAIAWSGSLDFDIFRKPKALKKGFVVVYSGTGRLLLAPMM